MSAIQAYQYLSIYNLKICRDQINSDNLFMVQETLSALQHIKYLLITEQKNKLHLSQGICCNAYMIVRDKYVKSHGYNSPMFEHVTQINPPDDIIQKYLNQESYPLGGEIQYAQESETKGIWDNPDRLVLLDILIATIQWDLQQYTGV